MSTTSITPNDIVIAVMGVTGVGKSSFISHFSDTAMVGNSLTSCTSEIGLHEAFIGDSRQRVILIDTPGFDDTHRSDTDILLEIAGWLSRSYTAKIELSGIIYLQRITDPRVGGSSRKNLRMFKKLCGKNGLSSVVLATTMWSQVDPDVGEEREQELISNEDFWRGMIDQGSTVMRHDNEMVSALKIIQHIRKARRRIVLDIQKEMADGRSLDETAAGQELGAEQMKMRKIWEKEMADYREEMAEARRLQDYESQKEIAAIRAETQSKMDKAREDEERRRVTFEQMQEERAKELENERMNTQKLRWEQEKIQTAAENKLREMEADHAHKMAIQNQEHELQRIREKARQLEEKEATRLRKIKEEEESKCNVM